MHRVSGAQVDEFQATTRAMCAAAGVATDRSFYTAGETTFCRDRFP